MSRGSVWVSDWESIQKSHNRISLDVFIFALSCNCSGYPDYSFMISSCFSRHSMQKLVLRVVSSSPGEGENEETRNRKVTWFGNNSEHNAFRKSPGEVAYWSLFSTLQICALCITPFQYHLLQRVIMQNTFYLLVFAFARATIQDLWWYIDEGKRLQLPLLIADIKFYFFEPRPDARSTCSVQANAGQSQVSCSNCVNLTLHTNGRASSWRPLYFYCHAVVWDMTQCGCNKIAPSY